MRGVFATMLSGLLAMDGLRYSPRPTHYAPTSLDPKTKQNRRRNKLAKQSRRQNRNRR